MLTPKEALLKDGKIAVKAGRGRMSVEAVNRVKELVAQGWDIKGYAVQSTPATTQAPKVVKSAAPVGKTIADLPPMRYDEAVWKAVSDVPFFGATEFGMREVCSNCHNSLNYHYCDAPVLFGGVPVRIVPK